MEHTAKKPREESSFASSSTSSGAISAATDKNYMPSTSSSAVPAQQPPAVHASEDDVFYGRTTRKMWKAQTEQAAALQPQQSPKWNEPDTDYTPPVKKPKKHREHGESKSSADQSTSSKKKKCPSVPKTPKAPKNSQSSRHSYSVEPSSTQNQMTPVSHNTPSMPKATAPPPTFAEHVPKVEDLADSKSYGQLDEKAHRETASTSTQAAAIQDVIETVLAQPEPSPSAPAQPTYSLAQNLPAPVAVYPSTQHIAPPPPPPPNVIPPSSELVAEQRHTFMIPPTDPLYNMVVSMYFEFKNYCNQAKMGDRVLMSQLRQEIESEKVRHNDLQEAINVTNSQIDNFLAKGVTFLKDRLDELGMTSVNDVTELLSGSKQIVTQHKSLTTTVAQMEATVAMEEQKLRMVGGPDAVRLFDEAMSQKINVDFLKLADLVVSSRPANFAAHTAQADELPGTDAKVSPSRRSRPKPRQTSSGGKRGASATRKAIGTSEDVELEIQQFVQHALKVDNAVKEKERKARGSLLAAAERMPRKGDK